MAEPTVMNEPVWPAPAKINLFLHIVGRRPDGYHLLQTIFQFLDYGDELRFEIREDGRITRLNELTGVPPEHDLVVRAAQALKHHAGTTMGVDIQVQKWLPMGGGLGGGSSNAATTLAALNVLWALDLDSTTLAGLGLALGADVPVFVRGRSAWAEGVGETMTDMDPPEPFFLVIHPGCQVPTGQIFNDPELTRNTPVSTIHGLSLAASRNDCEPVTRRLYPAVAAALDWLEDFAPARMSGTGACIFAPFATRAAAESVGHQVPRGWSWFVAAACNRSPLLDRVEVARRLKATK